MSICHLHRVARTTVGVLRITGRTALTRSYNVTVNNWNSRLNRLRGQHLLPNVSNGSRLALLRFYTNTNGGNAVKAKVKISRGDVLRLIKLAKSEKLVLAGALGCLIISSSITMVVPFAMGKLLDLIFNKDGISEDTLKNLKKASLILCGVFLLGGLANYGRVYLFNTASVRIVRDLRSTLYRRILNQEAGWFDVKGSGELLNRLTNDTYMVGNSLSQNLSDGLRSTVMVLAGTSMMIYTSPQLAMISTCAVPCVAGMAVVYGRYVRQITRQLLDKFAGISKFVEERLGNMRTVKMFCKEGEEGNSYDKLLDDAMKVAYREVMAKSIFFGLTGLSGNVIILSVLYYGGTLVINEALTVGALTSFILYATYSAISINGLSNFYTELNKGIGAAQRIWEICDRQCDIPFGVGYSPSTPAYGQVIFENVSFCFPSRQDNVILKNFSLTLSPGQTTAIVGRSGSGKTTIALLLMRLYDPLFGRIILDNMNLRDLNPVWLRTNIGAVNQEPVLFSGTIRENILYGLNPGQTVSDSEFEEIINKAHIHEFVGKLRHGLNTMVGQRGMMLSGGQKQRVAIARALIKNPRILILDEATSALDTISEELVQKALETLSQGRTVLTIAHRLSTIKNADKIAVLENGTICEEGCYRELMSGRPGVFKTLVSNQAFLAHS